MEYQEKFAEWQRIARMADEMAKRTSDMIRQRAIDVSAKHLGPTDGLCFMAAHNWHGQPWMTPEQNRAARLITYLERKMWEPSHVAEQLQRKSWNRLVADERIAKYEVK